MNPLESESIEIIREAVATRRNPVMMYSIGKDSSVMLHLARPHFLWNWVRFSFEIPQCGLNFESSAMVSTIKRKTSVTLDAEVLDCEKALEVNLSAAA